MPAEANPGVIVYTPEVLPFSQPWIRDHVAQLTRYRAMLAGRSAVPDGVALDGIRHVTLEGLGAGGAARLAFLLTGRSVRLERAIRDFAPAVIHAHFGPGGTEIAGAARRLGVPLVVSYHGWDALVGQPGRDRPPYERIHLHKRPAMLRQAALILATSAHLRGELLALGFPADKVAVHYMGVDTRLFTPPLRPTASRTLVFIGRLVDRKAPGMALDVVARLKAKVPGIRLTMIGDGPLRDSLEARARSEGLDVTFTGPLPWAEVSRHLAEARVHIMPSTAIGGHQPEPLGMVPLEAQASGVPSVGSRIGGIPEVIADGRSGFLVGDGDADAMAERIGMLMTDDALHADMARQAIAFVRETFDVGVNSRRLEARYDAVIAAAR